MIPPNTKQALHDIEVYLSNEECEGASFHSPTPLVVDSVHLVDPDRWPEEMGERAHDLWTKAPKAYLCSTCRMNVLLLLQLLHTHDGDLPWAIRREFGNKARALAMKGWRWYEKASAKT